MSITTTESDVPLVYWMLHSGKTTRSYPIAQGITSWEYFAIHVCKQEQPGDPIIVPRNVSWKEV